MGKKQIKNYERLKKAPPDNEQCHLWMLMLVTLAQYDKELLINYVSKMVRISGITIYEKRHAIARRLIL